MQAKVLFTESIFECAMQIGDMMLSNGAEVYRVEDTIQRICLAYGAERADVFAIPTSIVATATFGESNAFTLTRRIQKTKTDLTAVDRLNQLSRDICHTTPNAEHIRKRLEKIAVESNNWKHYFTMLGYIISAAAFCVFFGGTWRDTMIAGLASAMMFLIEIPLQKQSLHNVLMHFLLMCFGAAVAFFCVRFQIADNVNMIVIGEIMPYIPGMELTNGMRDVMAGDIVAGLSHLCEALFSAVAVAAGSAAVIAILGGLL